MNNQEIHSEIKAVSHELLKMVKSLMIKVDKLSILLRLKDDYRRIQGNGNVVSGDL